MPIVRDIDLEAWIRWVDTYCPYRGECTGPKALQSLCLMPVRRIAARVAEGWFHTNRKHPTLAGADRILETEWMGAEVAQIKLEIEAERRAK
jgi:hypothetical protein